MPVILDNYERNARRAVKTFWRNRERAQLRQQAVGIADQGGRAGVTAGKNMDGFVALAAEIVQANGLEDAEIHRQGQALTLPGYFRPTKLWDLIVINRGRLIAALEFKSQAGPSFGNNFNNRVEEAVGAAQDLWTAYREGAFGKQMRPFVGWMMLLEDDEKSRSSVDIRSPNFSAFGEFECASYADRYDIFCRKLVLEGLYTAASLVLSRRASANTGDYSELCEMTGLRTFASLLAGHAAAEAGRR